MEQKTAVDWLIDQVEDFIGLRPIDIIQQAKEMEKQQIMDAFDCALFGHGINGEPCASGGKYYTETYGK